MARSTKVILVFLGIVIVVGILFIWNAFHGNPISKMMAKKEAEKYIATQYSGTDYKIEDIFYNFKDGHYIANIVSPSSIDTHFELSVSAREVVVDSYEYNVPKGWNTYERIDQQYRDTVEKVFARDHFPMTPKISYGELILADEAHPDDFQPLDVGIDLTTLELDKNYDIYELGQKMGRITFYVEDDDVSYQRASELLLILKENFDEADVPFYVVDFVLQSQDEVNEEIHTQNILYDDIDEEGLEAHIKEAHEALTKYYEAIDQETLEN